jgi:hypothetical protein
MYNEIITRVRDFDAERLIVLEPGPMGRADGFPQLLDIVDDERLVFSFHFYAPDEFTHEGKNAFVARDVKTPKWPQYPLALKDLKNDDTRTYYRQNFPQCGEVLDKQYLRAECAPALAFQQQRSAITGRRTLMYIGEFGTARWMDVQSQIRWYTDAITLFEELDWGWAYFAYTPNSPYPHQATPFLSVGPEGIESNYSEDVAEASAGNNAYFAAYAEETRPSYDSVCELMRQANASDED